MRRILQRWGIDLVGCDFCDPHTQSDIHTRLSEGFQGTILQVVCERGQDSLPALQECHLHKSSTRVFVASIQSETCHSCARVAMHSRMHGSELLIGSLFSVSVRSLDYSPTVGDAAWLPM